MQSRSTLPFKIHLPDLPIHQDGDVSTINPHGRFRIRIDKGHGQDFPLFETEVRDGDRLLARLGVNVTFEDALLDGIYYLADRRHLCFPEGFTPEDITICRMRRQSKGMIHAEHPGFEWWVIAGMEVLPDKGQADGFRKSKSGGPLWVGMGPHGFSTRPYASDSPGEALLLVAHHLIKKGIWP